MEDDSSHNRLQSLIRLRLGTVIVGVDGIRFRITEDQQGRFDDYVSDKTPDVTVHASVGDTPRSRWLVSTPLWARGDHEAGILEIRMTEWHALLDVRANTVEARLEGPWPLAVGSLLKLLVQVYALTLGKGFVLHAAVVERGGRGVALMGRSGAGKTTAALLSRDAGMNVLSEEMSFVGAEPGGRGLAIYTLPFRQRGGLSPEPSVVPLEAAYWLEQAGADEVVPVPSSRSFLLAAAGVAVGIRHRLTMEPAIEASRQMASEVSIKLLRFRRSVDFWRAIDADLEA